MQDDNRARQATCGTCHHFVRGPVNPETLKSSHYCRRYPRTVSLQFLPIGNGQATLATAQANPNETFDAPACGEWRQRIGDMRKSEGPTSSTEN